PSRPSCPRGTLPQRPRGPNPPGTKPQGSFRAGGTAGLQRKPAPGAPQGMSPRFSGQETFQWTGLQRTNVQVTQHRADPRQVKEKTNLHQEHKGEARTSRWDSSPCAAAGTAAQKPSAPARITEQNSNAQSRYTTESASSILASFGLSNEDLEELSRYPDDQLTPENMPLILREIRLRKMGRPLSTLHPRSRGKEAVGSAGGPAVKSKVIDYGHASKYGYTEDPLEVCVYNPEVPTEDPLDVEDFPRDASMSLGVLQSGVTCNSTFPVEELMKQMGFQNESSSSRSFFAPEAAGKVSALCAAPAGLPVVKPVSQPAQPVAQHVMPALAQPPYSAELLAAVSQHERIPQEPVPSAAGPQSAPGAGPKPFPAQAEGPLKPPFALVKASWLPVFPQADAQKIKRLPTPSMMNDYYATSPRIFPHMCSLCNIECTHMKDWILHQNNPAHLESCRQLRHQYPDWNPECLYSLRNGGERKENQTPRRRSSSASPGPRRCRGAAAGCGPRRSRSRSRSPGRPRAARPRSRSPRQPRRLSPRHRSRSPQRARNPLRSGPRPPRSSSNDWASRRNPRSPDKKATLEAVVKSLGPGFVAELNKHKPLQAAGPGSSGAGKSPPSHGPLGKGPGNVKNKEMEEDEEDLFTETKELLNCGTVLQISDLPDDGFSDQDIKKIVQPFGKVSDLLVLRSRNEAFLEMNYKEAVIAAVKYGETVPVLVNGRRVKISVAERAKLPLSQVNTSYRTEFYLFYFLSIALCRVQPFIPVPAHVVNSWVRKQRLAPRDMAHVTITGTLGRVSSDLETCNYINFYLQELDDTCVVLISNLPEKGYSLEEISNLTKPFGGLKDVLMLSSHKKAYLEINRKSADSMVKFYTCFPMSLDGNQLCINVAPEYKTVKDEEAIFTVNPEAVHNKFVHLGNLPDDGYREVEVVCVGLRFGRVDHYVVLKNKNKAILQLETAKAAKSMYCFLNQNPYTMGEHTLTCALSPRAEPPEVNLPVQECFIFTEQNPLSMKSSRPDLTKCPEGSGVVQSAAANPPVEPSVAKPEPGSSRDAQGARSALPAAPRGSAGAAGEAAAAPTEPAAPQLREDEAQETQPPTAGARQEGTLGNNAGAESSEGAGVPGAAGEMGAEAPGWLGAAAEPGAAGGAPAEAVPPGPAAAPPHRVPPGDAPRGNPVPGAVRTATEVPAAQSGAAMDKKLGPPAETAAERERDVAGAQLEREMEESALRGGAAAEQKPAKASTESGTEAERKLERSVAKAGAGFENAEKNVNESNEGSLVKAHQNKGPEPAKADDTHKAVPLSSALSAKESPAVNKTFLKAVVSLPDISKARGPVRSNEPALDKAEGQKASPKPESRGQAAAEKKAAPEEVCAPRPAGTRPALPDGASRASRSAPGDEKGGNGRSSSQQEKVLRAESRASSKQCQDRESRASSAKRDSSSNQVRRAGRPSRFCFVTVDEVIEEIESPVRTRRNPPRGKRREAPKNTSSEPSCKRRKGKSSAARAAESELSFVTLDEIGEEEDVATQLLGAAPPDALADPQGLVVVDEVTEEEEAAARDPRSLLTLDEIAEREDLACHTGAPGPAFEEADLKAEPLVTVDEIGEVEELPLNEPADLNVDDAARQKEDDKDCGDFVSSQVPDDPGALVTVDEIQEDNEDAPLVTLDEVNEDEDDFLADFNCLKEELNFVTVDEVGEEDDEEDSLTEENLNEDEDEDIVAVAGPEEEDIALGASRDLGFNLCLRLAGDPLGSGERDPEPTRRRTDAADASRTRSAPKDLDFLVPKPGFFCQICSLFYADELSVKNHCKTRLHQQNMEKFMAKQKEGDNSSEERSLR
uniref:Zinc finger protein 638 n=1 Tax=Nothoprocta perdicaria TaxID=30464 RepID=A0A8C6ZFB6_NOTPE